MMRRTYVLGTRASYTLMRRGLLGGGGGGGGGGEIVGANDAGKGAQTLQVLTDFEAIWMLVQMGFFKSI